MICVSFLLQEFWELYVCNAVLLYDILTQISITLKLESMYARVKVMEKDIIVEKRKNVICQRARWNNPNDHE